MATFTRYIEDEAFALECKLFTSLAFLPVDLIQRGFRLVCDSVSDECLPLKRYFEITYIGYDDLSGRRPRHRDPIFDPAIWSVHSRVASSSPRTTNHLEGWHRRFSTLMMKAHPNIF